MSIFERMNVVNGDFDECELAGRFLDMQPLELAKNYYEVHSFMNEHWDDETVEQYMWDVELILQNAIVSRFMMEHGDDDIYQGAKQYVDKGACAI